MKYDIVIVGGGPAGLAAAVEAYQAGVTNILVVDIEEDKSVYIVNPDIGYEKVETKAIVLAMGCRERTRGAINIPGTRPAGIYSAGSAQRFINMEGYMVGKKVVILGSGDIGLIMARRMTMEGAEVQAVVELMPFSGGLQRNIVQCLDDYDIPLLLSHTITHIKGRERLEGVCVSKVDENRKPISGTEICFDCDTLLLSVGLIPENELSEAVGIELDPITSGPKVDESMQTSIEGIFACGNVVHVHDLVDYVTEEAGRAGKNAALYVQGLLKTENQVVETVSGSGIRYVIPQSVILENVVDKLGLYLRVSDVYHNVKLVVKADDVVIKEVKKRHMAPGEMESITIDIEVLRNINPKEICVEVNSGERLNCIK